VGLKEDERFYIKERPLLKVVGGFNSPVIVAVASSLKEVNMPKIDVSKIAAILGLLLVLMAIIMKIGGASPVDVGLTNVRLISLLVIANTCFLVAILLKK